ncbi:MAG: DUF3052 domain-containing protein [Bacteroidota bacterium]
MSTSGYSGTPLARKLGIKAGYVVKIFFAPRDYLSFFGEFPEEVRIVTSPDEPLDMAHLFVTTMEELERGFAEAKPALKMTGSIWVSWPKKTSGIPTELDKFAIMQYGLDMGLVDVKVAAIDETWSGHKFMYRVKDRK